MSGTSTTLTQVTVSSQRWILPGVDLTGQCAVVLVVPGLLVAWKGLSGSLTVAGG